MHHVSTLDMSSTSPLVPSSSAFARPSISHPSSFRNNPISLRIYKAIGTTFDDPASREALEIASSFYTPRHDYRAEGSALPSGSGSTSASASGAPRGETGHESDAEDDSDEEDLPRRTLVKGQTAAMARKYLRRDVESKLAGGSQKFLKAFGEVDKVSSRGSRYCAHVARRSFGSLAVG
jgi:hypothetical protein